MDVIEAVTNAGLKYNEEAAVDVCKAIQEMKTESERNGAQKKSRALIALPSLRSPAVYILIFPIPIRIAATLGHLTSITEVIREFYQ